MSKTQNVFLVRHGETDWAKSGKHTGRTDIPLTEHGKEQAAALKPILAQVTIAGALTSPLTRAKETAAICGFGHATVCDALAEVDYGAYEGLTTVQIRESVPGWAVWTHPCVNGETLQQAASRAAQVIAQVREYSGNVVLFSHGHMLRILTATWLELPPTEGRHFMLDTATLCVLSYERETPAIRIWNAPIDCAAVLKNLA